MRGPRRPLILALALFPALVAAHDMGAIEKRGTLRVLAMADDPKDEFMTRQPGLGMDRELLEAFAKLRQLRLEIVPVSSWDGLVPALLQDKGDLIAGRFTVTEARQKQIDFTPEVFPTRNVVLTRKPQHVVGTLEELRREKVGTVKGTSLADPWPRRAFPPPTWTTASPRASSPTRCARGGSRRWCWGSTRRSSSAAPTPTCSSASSSGPRGPWPGACGRRTPRCAKP